MFATRGNNENAIYNQQTAAAAKPLNQGAKGLAPKTPAHKAGLKVSLNNENAAFKTGGKGKGGGFFAGEGKGEKADKSAFVTPAGPRNRAPLGNKTTNAKAIHFQTPAVQSQGKGSVRATSPRLRRAKVKVQVDPLNATSDGEEREIEYMAPREVPLPDHPDDWPADRKYPQFEGRNLTKGWMSEFQPHKDEDEDDLSDFEEKLKRIEQLEKKRAAQMATRKAEVSESKPSALNSKRAVSALCSTSSGRNFAAPTASTRAKLPSLLVSKKAPSMTSTLGNERHTAAKVASNTTLGYSKGRSVSANTRKPLSSVYRAPTPVEGISKSSPMRTPFGGGINLDQLLGLTSIDDDDDAHSDALIGNASAVIDEGDDLVDFQLDYAQAD